MGAFGAILLVAALGVSATSGAGHAGSGGTGGSPSSPAPADAGPPVPTPDSSSAPPDSAVPAGRGADAAAADTILPPPASLPDSSTDAAGRPGRAGRSSKTSIPRRQRARITAAAGGPERPSASSAQMADAGAPTGARPVQAASAQADDSEADRVAREIARTAMWLARAGPLVQTSRNDRATETLESAEDFQGGARDAYEVQQYARAQRLTQAARDYAERAIRMAGPAIDDPDYVKTVLRHTEDALDRLRDYLESDGDDAARRRYDSLKDDQKDARNRLEAGDARGAYKATTRVRDGVLELLRNAPPGEVPCESAKKAVENAEESRGRVRKSIGPHPDGATTHFLAAADQQLARAHALLNRGNCRDAVLRAKAAERQLEKAIDASRKAGKAQP
jgi:tetratricopeptide (TPR) repeat protein